MHPTSRLPAPIERFRTPCLFLAALSLGGCFGATDAIPLRIDGGSSTDAGSVVDAATGPWTGSTADLACYPVQVFQVSGGFGFSWTQGTPLDARDFLGVLVDPSEQARAEALIGHDCSGEIVVSGKVLCEVFESLRGPPTRESYETICAIEASLGPHSWIARAGD